ncbi:MAG: hypothetical protein ACLQNE_15080 [Thermoguttaceae bacterium]
MRLERDFPDYRFEGREDACRILDNHTDEIADALVLWHKTDRSQSFNLNDVDGHSWAFEGHRYSGMTFDLWTGCAVLESIPAEFHESDSTQWTEHRRLPGESRIQIGPPKGLIDLPETVASMGHSTYENYVECCAGEMLEAIAKKAKGLKRLGKKGAEKIVQAVIDECREENEESEG